MDDEDEFDEDLIDLNEKSESDGGIIDESKKGD